MSKMSAPSNSAPISCRHPAAASRASSSGVDGEPNSGLGLRACDQILRVRRAAARLGGDRLDVRHIPALETPRTFLERGNGAVQCGPGQRAGAFQTFAQPDIGGVGIDDPRH